MVTSASKKTPTIKYTGSSDKTKKKVIIPKTVTIDGVEYKVTSIGKKAFRNNKPLKSNDSKGFHAIPAKGANRRP